MKTPKIIYLQQINDDEITWCDDQINDDDVEYIKKSEYDRIIQRIDKISSDEKMINPMDEPLTDQEHAIIDEFTDKQNKIALLCSLISDLKQDAERLAEWWRVPDDDNYHCHYCGCYTDSGSEEWHDENCPIVQHINLMEKIEREGL
jgi:hypothetical protein